MVTIRRAQRKVFEIYDRIMFSGIGNQADIETLRISSIDFAHQEGFNRSPDDVSVHRLVGFSLSPPLKKAFGDQFTAPFVVRAIFAEMGRRKEEDSLYVLNYDGEFTEATSFAVVGGTLNAEDQMALSLIGVNSDIERDQAISRAFKAWSTGVLAVRKSGSQDHEESEIVNTENDEELNRVLEQELKTGVVEAAVLERSTLRESKFRHLTEKELEPILSAYRSGT